MGSIAVWLLILLLVALVRSHDSQYEYHNWWENQFIVNEDEMILEDGSTVIVAAVGTDAYLNFTGNGVLQAFGINPCNMIVADFDSLSYSDSMFELLPSRKSSSKQRSLLVLRGAEKLYGENMSRLDVILSIADKAYMLSDTVVLWTWKLESSDHSLFADSKSWTTHFLYKFGQHAPHSNGHAIIGRIRRIGMQNPSLAVAQKGDLRKCDSVIASLLSLYPVAYVAKVAFAVAVYYYANQIFFVTVPYHKDFSCHYFYEVSS
jgi:hypothetical protein